MARIRLRSLLGKSEPAVRFLDSLQERLGEVIQISNEKGVVVYGPSELIGIKTEIRWEDKVLGNLVGGAAIVDLTLGYLDALLEKEREKRALGREVLDLYREVNLNYDFSEQLAGEFDPHAIARLALKEAQRLIPAMGGMFLIWEEEQESTQILAEFGASLFRDAPSITDLERFRESQAEIFTYSQLKSQFNGSFTDVEGILYAPLMVKNESHGGLILGYKDSREYTAADLKLLTSLATHSASAIESSLQYERRIQEAREREETMREVHEATIRFVPMEFIESLNRKSLLEVRLGDYVEQDVTVMFVDIRGYTTLAERMTPEENFRFISAFNGRFNPVVKENHGFINQYLGDGFMAIFPEKPEDALCAAIDIQRAVRVYNQVREDQEAPRIRVGIGMHTGSLIMGITGDKDRWDAAVISDTVNTASRIESLTKSYLAPVMLSRQTLDKLQDNHHFHLRPLGKVLVKGKSEAVDVFECFDGDPPESFKRKKETLPSFIQGINLYLGNAPSDARLAFQEVLQAYPGDETVQQFLSMLPK